MDHNAPDIGKIEAEERRKKRMRKAEEQEEHETEQEHETGQEQETGQEEKESVVEVIDLVNESSDEDEPPQIQPMKQACKI